MQVAFGVFAGVFLRVRRKTVLTGSGATRVIDELRHYKRVCCSIGLARFPFHKGTSRQLNGSGRRTEKN